MVNAKIISALTDNERWSAAIFEARPRRTEVTFRGSRGHPNIMDVVRAPSGASCPSTTTRPPRSTLSCS